MESSSRVLDQALKLKLVRSTIAIMFMHVLRFLTGLGLVGLLLVIVDVNYFLETLDR